jgi:excisionase family DNA binding protein
MGSTSSPCMSFDEAANRLNVTKRSIHNYIKKGFLRRVVRGSTVLVYREEVEQLAEDSGTDLPALSRKTLLDMSHRIRKLEEQMVMVQEIWSTWGVVEKPLRPAPEEAAGLFRAATSYLTADKYQLKEIESWAVLFVQIDEKTLMAVAEATKTLKPWEVFYTLVDRMLSFLSKSKELKGSLHLQSVKAKLDVGRRKLREAAMLWIEDGRGSVDPSIFRSLDSPKEDLIRTLSRQSGKTG